MGTVVASLHPKPTTGGHLAGFVWTLVRTDFKTRYHGTVLGFAWALLKPLTMFLVLMGVFSYIFATDPDYRVNLIIGLFLWDFFSHGTSAGLGSLREKGYLISKARFPSWIIVVTSISNAIITLGAFCIIIVVALAAAGHAPLPLAIGLFLWYLLQFTAIVIGFALASSVLFLRYGDLDQVWEVALQAGFFIAPIVYPLKILPVQFHTYLYLWPPTAVIEFVRAVLTTGSPPSVKAHLFLTAGTAVALAIGILIFRRNAPRAVEYL